jgi:pyruvate dehydrogenase E2 component (dihydrolipoamide acetyltransferase)
MEALSPTMEEGRLVAWKKREGEAVKAGDTLAEVETDKAVMELVARGDGVLRKIVLGEGSTVPVGALVAVVGAVDEDISGITAATPPSPGVGGRVSGVGGPATEAPHPTPSPSRVRSSPLARRLAAERGLDLTGVAGTGPQGRVIKRDVETADRQATPASGLPAGTPARPAPPLPSGYRDAPLTTMRKAIARRLAQSLGPVPHFFLTTEIDMERAWEAREQIKSLGDAYEISFNDLVLKAVALALKKHPGVNAAFLDDKVRYYGDVHVGMAVAVEDGLITPVIRHADRKRLVEIAEEAKGLAEREIGRAHV